MLSTPPAPTLTEVRGTLVLVKTERLTVSTSIHYFSAPADVISLIRPTQHIVLQFPEDLDPIAGGRNLSDEERRLYFTPCQLRLDTESGSLALLSKNGRVTSLLSQPRPSGDLTAAVIGVGGGFSEDLMSAATTCIAGGTGIACFAAMGGEFRRSTLVCSMREDEFGVFEALFLRESRQADRWGKIKVFITGGPDGFRSEATLQNRLTMCKRDNVQFSLGRMEESDVKGMHCPDTVILFCGGKSLEWQVRLWALRGAAVFTTGRT